MGKLLSVNVGLPRNVSWNGQMVWTAVWKTAVDGPRAVRKLNLEGDGQGDLNGHGGEHRAVFVYQRDSYDFWAKELHRDDFVMGQFGENFTVDGLPDDEVCIGDHYRIGDALFEVSQPRVTCYRVGIRMNDPQMPSLLVARGRPGFYFRVLQEGTVKAGDSIALIARGTEGMTVREIDALLYLPGHSREGLERARGVTALSPGWRRSFDALLERGDSNGGNPGLVADLAPAAAWPGFREARIADLTHETRDVVALDLELTGDDPLPAPLPGQFVVVRVRPPGGAPPVMRSYSICGVTKTARYRFGIKREPHGIVGTYFTDTARKGDVLEMSAPRGSFVLEAGKDPVVLISAGIGVTPVLAMLDALVNESPQRDVWWLYAARNAAEHPFATEARRLLESLQRGRSHVWYSRPEATEVKGRDYDSSGHIDAGAFEELGIPRSSHFYLCGPTGLIDALRAQLSGWGIAADHVHTEFFGSRPPVTPGIVAEARGTPHQPSGAPGDGPSVSFARSSLQVSWRSTFSSLLELAEACDVPVRWSCRTGVCHTCQSGVIAGGVRYNPEPLEQPAQGDALICCSVPNGDVVLDL